MKAGAVVVWTVAAPVTASGVTAVFGSAREITALFLEGKKKEIGNLRSAQKNSRPTND
ncbi:hypothetical protein KUV73_03975 [Mameliella alba]|nr:hypothetical protein [Mameliella alba]MBY6168484.1 hypothetical protein [Mameliella alba]MBY6173503.1 hypothetical protein [Mameliella alba]